MKGIDKDYIMGGEPMRVLKKINLSIREGEYLSVLGPSGSGKSMTPQDALSQGGLVGGAVAGAMGNVYQTIINKQFDGDNKTTNITNGGNSYYPTKVYSRRYYGGGGGGYDYNPKIYSNPHSLYSSKPATMYSKTPYSTRNQTYLRPSFSTKGSREAYKRQDF